MIKTTATDKIFALRKRIRGVNGGTGASKTISILLWLIQRCQTNDNELWSVTTDFFPRLQKGAIRDFMNIMEEHKYFQPNSWNKTDHIYTFDGTKSQLEFFSSDQSAKVRGPRRTGIFINEANTISLETFRQLDVRSEKVVWLDWNPVQEFWWYTDIVPNFDVDSLVLTYKDNEGLSPQQVQAIEAYRYNKNWWRIFGEGQLGMSEGIIYNFFPIDDVPPDARLVRYGLDFGYSNDPTAIVAIYQWNNAYIWDEIFYRKGLSNKDISDILINLDKALVVADSAEPKSIDEMKSYGLSVMGSQKGPGSILQGVQYVQDQKIYVTKKSTNIWHEQRNYLWLTDKEGKIINEPSPFLNHLMDAGRYGMESLRPIDPKDIQLYGNDYQNINQGLANKWRI